MIVSWNMQSVREHFKKDEYAKGKLEEVKVSLVWN
jgi:hypothetical protein